LGFAVAAGVGVGFAVAVAVGVGVGGRLGGWLGVGGWAWEDSRVKLSGSAWLGYGVVVVVTFVVGFLAFAVWVLSKVF